MGWCGEWCIAKRQAEGREEAVGGGWRMWGGGRLEEGSCCRREQAALECFFRQTEKSKHISDSAEIFNSIVRGSQGLPWRSALLRGRHLQTFCPLCRAASSSSSWLMLLFFTSSQLLWPPPSASLSYISSCSLKMKCYFIPVLYYLPFWLLSSDGVEIRGNEALVATSVEKKKERKRKKMYYWLQDKSRNRIWKISMCFQIWGFLFLYCSEGRAVPVTGNGETRFQHVVADLTKSCG